MIVALAIIVCMAVFLAIGVTVLRQMEDGS